MFKKSLLSAFLLSSFLTSASVVFATGSVASEEEFERDYLPSSSSSLSLSSISEDTGRETGDSFSPLSFSISPDPISENPDPALQDENLSSNRPPSIYSERAVVLAVARNPQHNYWLTALTLLWDSGNDFETADRAILRPLLLEMALQTGHPQQMSAITLLWNSSDAHENQNRFFLSPRLLQIAQDSDAPGRWDAVSKLWHSGGTQQAQNRLSVRPFLLEIIQDQDVPARHREDALFCLRESDQPIDRMLAQALPPQRPGQRNIRKKLFCIYQPASMPRDILLGHEPVSVLSDKTFSFQSSI